MSDRMEMFHAHNQTVGDLYLWLLNNRVPVSAWLSTDMEGENIVYFEWNENE